jgi:transcriptional regulator with XRE-family HTH domain
MMLGMSQEKLGDALGLTFQQVQKYEKGTNRVSASRLQHISRILQVPIMFFFDGAPEISGQATGANEQPIPIYVSEFLSTSDGLSLATAFAKVSDRKLREIIVDLVERLADQNELEPKVERQRTERLRSRTSQAMASRKGVRR